MEPNIPRVSVKKCASKEEADRELIRGLLANDPMSLQMLVTILESDPYNLVPIEITEALNQLNRSNLIKIGRFTDTWLAGSSVGVDIVLYQV